MTMTGRYTASQCEFFVRNAGFPEFAADVAPGLQAMQGGELLIADPACSSGESTLCLGAALMVAGVDFRIEASDIRDDVLKRASSQSYCIDRARFMRNLANSRFPMACADFFEFDASGNVVRPVDALGSRVTYRKHDIIAQRLPVQRYGAVALHNVLGHYLDHEADRMIGLALCGLLPGGALLVDDFKVGVPERQRRAHRLEAATGVPEEVQAKVLVYSPDESEFDTI